MSDDLVPLLPGIPVLKDVMLRAGVDIGPMSFGVACVYIANHITTLTEQLEAARRDATQSARDLEARLADALERGFWAGRACGGSKADIDAALAALKGEANE